jgi:prophage regulatory protein
MVCSNPQVTTMKILRIKQVMAMTGLARSTIYKYIKDGGFPKSVKLSVRAVGWVQSDIEVWILSKLSSRDEC